MNPKENYAKKLRDPRWQKKRLEILQRDGWACRWCGDEKSTLHIHHLWYEQGRQPWQASDAALLTICEPCHEEETGQRIAWEEQAILRMRQLPLSANLWSVILDGLAFLHRRAGSRSGSREDAGAWLVAFLTIHAPELMKIAEVRTLYSKWAKASEKPSK